MNCPACNRATRLGETLSCKKCKQLYHYSCLNMTTAHYMQNKFTLDKSWICPSCENVTTRRRINDDTPLKPPHSYTLDDSTMSTEDIQDCKEITVDAQNTSFSLNNLSLVIQQNNHTILTQIKDTIQAEINKAMINLREGIKQETNLLFSQNKEIKTDLEKMKTEIEMLKHENKQLKTELNKIKNESQNKNNENQNYLQPESHSKKIILYGLSEYHDETEHDLHYRVLDIFRSLLNVDLTGYIEETRRIGRKFFNKTRPLEIELISKKMTKYIIENKYYIQDENLSISEFLDKNTLQLRKMMREKMFSARKEGLHAVIRNNKLYIEGQQTDIYNTETRVNQYVRHKTPSSQAQPRSQDQHLETSRTFRK